MKNNIIAMRVTDEERKSIEILRKKYFVNISELFRKTILDYLEKLENEQNEPKELRNPKKN